MGASQLPTVWALTAPLTSPEFAKFTQGTIFSGGVAEDYENSATYGLVITARCDAVNDKTETYNYLPVVSLDDWLHVDGTFLLTQRIAQDVNNGLRNILRANGYAVSIMEGETPREILNKLFPDNEKKLAGSRKQFLTLCEKWEKLEATKDLLPKDGPFCELMSIDIKASEQFTKELLQNKLLGYYFIKSVSVNGDDLGYVILLREVHNMKRDLVDIISRVGIDFFDFAEMCKSRAERVGRLNIRQGDAAMPLSVLGSPHIEHILQVFSTLFGGIGVPDIAASYIQDICSRQPSLRRGGQ